MLAVALALPPEKITVQNLVVNVKFRSYSITCCYEDNKVHKDVSSVTVYISIFNYLD